VDVTAEERLNINTFIDGDLLCFLYFFESNHNYFNCSLLVRLQLLNFKWLSGITVTIIAGNFDRVTNPYPHPNPTDFAHEIRIRRPHPSDADIGWLHHIPKQNQCSLYQWLKFHVISDKCGNLLHTGYTSSLSVHDRSLLGRVIPQFHEMLAVDGLQHQWYYSRHRVDDRWLLIRLLTYCTGAATRPVSACYKSTSSVSRGKF